eukprot:419643-Rhodomonas_salina.1
MGACRYCMASPRDVTLKGIQRVSTFIVSRIMMAYGTRVGIPMHTRVPGYTDPCVTVPNSKFPQDFSVSMQV